MLRSITNTGFLWILSNICCEAVNSNLLIHKHQDTIITNLHKFMLEIGNVYFEDIELIHITLPTISKGYTMFYNVDLNDVYNVVGRIQKKWPVLISEKDKTVFISNPLYLKVSHYILFLTTTDFINEFIIYLELLRIYKESWNPRAMFMFVVLQSKENYVKEHTEEISIRFFNYLWSINIFKVFLFSADFNELNKTKIVSALPYTSSQLCRHNNSSELIYWHSNNSLESNIELFTFNVPNNFHGCPMIAMTYPFPPYAIAEEFEENNNTKYKYVSGIEVNLVKLVAERFNINITIETPNLALNPWINIFPDNKSTGILPNLFEFKTDIAFGGVIPVYRSYFKIDFTKCHSFGSISWFVADPSKLPQWTILIRVFKTRPWIILGLTFIVFSFVVYLISKFGDTSNEYQIYTSYSSIIMILYVLGLSNSVQKSPKTIYLRLLFFTWSIYSLHIVITYQQHLFSLMVNPTLEKSIDTLEQLKESGLKTCLSGLFYSLFGNNFNDSNLQTIFGNNIICNDTEESIELLMKYKNFSILEKSENIEFISNKMASNFHKVSDVLMTYNVGIMTSKGNIVLDTLNTVIQNSQETGLISKWENEIKFKSSGHKIIQHKTKALTLDDLQGAFLILFLGLFFSFTVFLCEIY